MRPQWFALLGIVGLALTGCGAVVALEWLRPDGYNTQAINNIISIIAPTMALMVPVAISLNNSKKIDENTEITKEK